MDIVPMPTLLLWWTQLGAVPVNDDGILQEPFRHFPRGTFCEDVWRWFEAANPSFITGQIMAGVH